MNKFFIWLENLLFFNEFPHDDPCFGCNKASCIEPVKCKLIGENRFIMDHEVDNEETFR